MSLYGDREEAKDIWIKLKDLQQSQVQAFFEAKIKERDAKELYRLVWAEMTGRNWEELTGLGFEYDFKDMSDLCLEAVELACELTEYKIWQTLNMRAQLHWKRSEPEEAVPVSSIG